MTPDIAAEDASNLHDHASRMTWCRRGRRAILKTRGERPAENNEHILRDENDSARARQGIFHATARNLPLSIGSVKKSFISRLVARSSPFAVQKLASIRAKRTWQAIPKMSWARLSN